MKTLGNRLARGAVAAVLVLVTVGALPSAAAAEGSRAGLQAGVGIGDITPPVDR